MPTTEIASPRRSLFDRPEAPPPGRLTERDVLIARSVARFRFLSQPQICRLVPGSAQGVGRRTRFLFMSHILDSPKVQRQLLAHVFDTGNVPLVYGLGREGARLIAPDEPWLNAESDWSYLNNQATALNLAHTTETADFVIDLELALSLKGDGWGLIDHHRLLPSFPEETRRPRPNHNPFKLVANVNGATPHAGGVRKKLPGLTSNRIAVVPDRVLSIVHGHERHNRLLEWDRGTMSNRARISKKLLGYYRAWQQQLHTTQWNFQSFQVAFVTPSRARLDNWLALQKEITGGSRLFLFSTPKDIAEHGVLGLSWVNGKGENVALV